MKLLYLKTRSALLRKLSRSKEKQENIEGMNCVIAEAVRNIKNVVLNNGDGPNIIKELT